jgi:subtilisin family serine protease
VIAGVDFVAGSNVRPAVANMSLGGGASSTLDSAVANAVSKGVTMVVAAGNSNANACNYSPARTASAITVGATTSSDARASYSNYGTCLDLFAPGSSITSAWYNSDTSTSAISGTSMAAPHVAGVAALALQFNSARSPGEVVNLITAGATTGKVTSAGSGSPNRLLYSLVDGGSGGGNLPPTASFIFSCSELTCSFNGSSSTDSDGSISSYSWNFGDGTNGAGATVSKTYATGGTRTVTLTVTDDDGATGSQSQSVTTIAPGGGGGGSLSGSSTNNGGTWTAMVTLSGSVGASTSGNWSIGTSSGCSITSGTSCSFSLGGIPKRTGSVTYTDSGSLGSVTIGKP